ncbi:hypothetical protein GCM10010489_38060 [Microbacterium saperdae]|nr:hypothetical protein GCM10010489_38060 [Microbacterium saperdae]
MFIGQTLAATCTGLIERGWSEWLYLAFFWALWNGLKFLLFGPWSVVHVGTCATSRTPGVRLS